MGFAASSVASQDSPTSFALWRVSLAAQIGFLDFLHHLEEPRPAGDAVGLDGRSGGKADGLGGSALVRHNKVRGERIKSPLHALHGGVEGFEVYGDVGF